MSTDQEPENSDVEVLPPRKKRVLKIRRKEELPVRIIEDVLEKYVPVVKEWYDKDLEFHKEIVRKKPEAQLSSAPMIRVDVMYSEEGLFRKKRSASYTAIFQPNRNEIFQE